MMDKILFTKREQQVMELLWNSADSLSAHDLVEKSGLSVYTVQQVLQRLLKSEYIKVDGIGRTYKSLTRQYSPVLSQADYIQNTLEENTHFQLAAGFIDKTSSLEQLDQLEKMIQEQKEKLKL